MKRCFPMSYKSSNFNQRAFTLIELLVSVVIFTMMTVLVVVKYGSFNQSVLMTNLAFDVSLAIRTAQTYGLSVKNIDTGSTQFQYAYGVRFDMDQSLDSILNNGNKKNQEIVFYADRNNDGVFTAADVPVISTYAIKRGATIFGICTGSSSSCIPAGNSSSLNITFKRPDPTAKMCLNGSLGSCGTAVTYAEIKVRGTDGSVRNISVRDNGQISVKD